MPAAGLCARIMPKARGFCEKRSPQSAALGHGPLLHFRFPKAASPLSAQATPWRRRRAGGCWPLRALGDMVRQMRRVVFDTKDKGRRPSGQPAQPKEVQSGHISYAAPMHRRAPFVKRVYLQPAEIERVSRCPDDSDYSGAVEV